MNLWKQWQTCPKIFIGCAIVSYGSLREYDHIKIKDQLLIVLLRISLLEVWMVMLLAFLYALTFIGKRASSKYSNASQCTFSHLWQTFSHFWWTFCTGWPFWEKGHAAKNAFCSFHLLLLSVFHRFAANIVHWTIHDPATSLYADYGNHPFVTSSLLLLPGGTRHSHRSAMHEMFGDFFGTLITASRIMSLCPTFMSSMNQS